MTISVFQRIWHRFVTPFAETEPFASPFQDYAPNVSDSDSAPVVSLAVKSLASSLRHDALRNMESPGQDLLLLRRSRKSRRLTICWNHDKKMKKCPV